VLNATSEGPDVWGDSALSCLAGLLKQLRLARVVNSAAGGQEAAVLGRLSAALCGRLRDQGADETGAAAAATTTAAALQLLLLAPALLEPYCCRPSAGLTFP
jgi:hypothetical protein